MATDQASSKPDQMVQIPEMPQPPSARDTSHGAERLAEAKAEAAAAPPSLPINLVMPDEAPKRFQMVVDEKELDAPAGFEPIPVAVTAPPASAKSENARDAKERIWHEEQEAKRRGFVQAYAKANEVEEKPVVVQPVAPAVAEQTRLEQEAGRKMNEHHLSLRGGRPPTVKNPSDGSMVPVFRPADYVQPKMSESGVPVDGGSRVPTHTPTRSYRQL